MNNPELVSVLIPTYNYARFLDEAIQSVFGQSYQNFELIIVDNNSTDNTTEIVSKYLNDPRVSFYKNKKNLGLVGNWNKCLEYAKGTYIKFLLADDKFAPTVLEEMVSVMRRYPNVVLVTSNSEMFGSRSKLRISNFIGLQKGRELIYNCLKEGSGNLIGEPTTVMIRKSTLDEVGKFNAEYACLVDFNFWLRLLNHGDAYFIAKSLSYFRVHNDQFSSKLNVGNWIEEYKFYREVKNHNPYQVEPKQFHHLGLDHVIKDRAMHCERGLYRILPRFFKGNNPNVISKILAITAREGILGKSILGMVKRNIH